MKLLITGGAGFIGSHLCNQYVKAGHSVLCLDNFLSGRLVNIKHLVEFENFELVKGDVRDFDLIQRLMRDIDVVFHLAAQIHVDRSYLEPQLTYEINVNGTQNILEAAKTHKTSKVIYASSSEVYGSALYTPIDEKHPLNAPHPYGASKIAADRMCHAYIQTYGINIAIVRSFNVFGPQQKAFGYGGVISMFMRQIMNGMSPTIYGDGLQSRDYTYFEDILSAYDLILNYKEPLLEPINFGSGHEIRILDLANTIIEFCGKREIVKPVHIAPRIGEIKRLIADATKAKTLLGWSPKYSFHDGLKAFIEWHQKHGWNGSNENKP